MSALVNLQLELVQRRHSVLDEVWAAAADADVPAQQALPSDSADVTAQQSPPGCVSSLPAHSMLNKPTCKAVETLQDQEQQAIGGGKVRTPNEAEEEAGQLMRRSHCLRPAVWGSNNKRQYWSKARKRRKQSGKGHVAAGEAEVHHRNAAPAASDGLSHKSLLQSVPA